MKMFDEDALAIADAVRDVIEGRIKKEVAEPEAKGEKDFKDAHTIDKEDDVEEDVSEAIADKELLTKTSVDNKGKTVVYLTYKEKEIVSALRKGADDNTNKHLAKAYMDDSDIVHAKSGKTMGRINIKTTMSDLYKQVHDYIAKNHPPVEKSIVSHPTSTRSIVTSSIAHAKEMKDAFHNKDTKVRIMARKTGAMVYFDSSSEDIHKAVAKKLDSMVHEAVDVEEAVTISAEETAKQKKYQDFFKKALAKFGAKSPQDLDKEKRAEFFDYIDKNYEADDEVSEDSAEDSAPMVEAPSTVIHAEMPFQLFDKAGTSMMFNLSKDWNVTAVAQSNDRYVAFAGEPRDLEKMLKNHPKLKGKVDVKAIMSTAVKFTGKEKFGRQKGANFTN